MGTFIFTLSVTPNSVSVSTVGNVALSGSGSTPLAPSAYPEFGFGIHGRKCGFIRIRFNPLGTQRVPHDIQVGVINRVVLVCPGSNFAERLRVKQFPAPEGCLEHIAVSLAAIQASAAMEHIAVSLAAIQASAANTGLGSHIAGSVPGLKRFIRSADS
jgi:hypothetical protein